MNARALSMSNDDPVEHPHAVLPPPPSSPDDGPSALDVPPLAAPPRSLHPSNRSIREGWSLSPRGWLGFVALFLVGTLVTFLLQR